MARGEAGSARAEDTTREMTAEEKLANVQQKCTDLLNEKIVLEGELRSLRAEVTVVNRQFREERDRVTKLELRLANAGLDGSARTEFSDDPNLMIEVAERPRIGEAVPPIMLDYRDPSGKFRQVAPQICEKGLRHYLVHRSYGVGLLRNIDPRKYDLVAPASIEVPNEDGIGSATKTVTADLTIKNILRSRGN